MSVKVIYGSTTGTTESVAQQIAAALGTEAINVANASAADFAADLLVLGSSTWGYGELQDDWAANISLLENADFTGHKVAVFGMGDQSGFSDTYCDAMGIIAEKAKASGATLVGATSAAGYEHSASVADQGGTFCGLALDDTNQPDKTAERIAAWVAEIQK